MGRGVTRVTQAVAVALLAGAASGAGADAAVGRRLPAASSKARASGCSHRSSGCRSRRPSTDVTVNWTIVAGSATLRQRLHETSGTLTFMSPRASPRKSINVQINGDTIDEWTRPTLPPGRGLLHPAQQPLGERHHPEGSSDDHADRRRPPDAGRCSSCRRCQAATRRHRAEQAAVARPGRPDASRTTSVIRWNTGPTCSFPPSTTSLSGTDRQGLCRTFRTPRGPAQSRPRRTPACRSTRCTATRSSPSTPRSRTTEIAKTSRPRPSTQRGPIAWTYSPGCYRRAATTSAPPTVGLRRDLLGRQRRRRPRHAARPVGRGVAARSWNPVALGEPTQNRSPVVPLTACGWRLFVGTDGGGVHAVDGRTGDVDLVAQRRASATRCRASPARRRRSPPGLFKSFGGNNDMLLVGTNNGWATTRSSPLDPADRAPRMDPIYTHAADGRRHGGMAVVDYAGATACTS